MISRNDADSEDLVSSLVYIAHVKDMGYEYAKKNNFCLLGSDTSYVRPEAAAHLVW